MLEASQRQELLRFIRACDRVNALIFLRRDLKLDLKDAVKELDKFQRDLDPNELYAENHMGMSADILAVGEYSKDILGFMEYPPKFYSDTRDGAPIVRLLFEVHEGSSRSRQLASCFGIDPWDFNQHRLHPHAANLEELRVMFGAEEVDVFSALAKAGFKFYFRPNG